MATGCCSSDGLGGKVAGPGQLGSLPDPIRTRYPMVCEDETPLPRQWSSKDKYSFLGLSQSNLRVHYKGIGKNHKDAASVRATHPIPAACGIYYFEVKVVSKGREGYMGIGLSTVSVNMNRLPGWEKNSYGYHGDDGNSFCSSGTGQPYGPTFTTGDVIGCCVNLIDSTCFYTKNGVNLGIAFRNLPTNLYPTVGLQTPGEVVEANFGQSPFLFDIDDYMKEWRMKTRNSIEYFAVTNKNGEWQTALQKIVSSYLIHNGYCATAEAFAHCTGQPFEEELASIRNRQKIQKLILSGHIGDAISTIQQLYPGLLEQNPNLLFTLKCRQFIEMVNGTDMDPSTSPSYHSSPCPGDGGGGVFIGAAGSGLRRSSPSATGSPAHNSSTSSSLLIRTMPTSRGSASPGRAVKSKSHSPNGTTVDRLPSASPPPASSEDQLNACNVAMNGAGHHQDDGSQAAAERSHSDGGAPVDTPPSSVVLSSVVPQMILNSSAARPPITQSANDCCSDDDNYNDDDDEMDTCEAVDGEKAVVNGALSNGSAVPSTLPCVNGSEHYCRTVDHDEADMETDQRQPSVTSRQLYSMSEANLERILQFGRELHMMGEQLKREHGRNEANKKILKDAFSLLAYSDPWSSSVGHQLHPIQREPICTSVNSAILELQGLPKQPPLELAIAHAKQCVKLMSRAGIGACAFANVADYLH